MSPIVPVFAGNAIRVGGQLVPCDVPVVWGPDRGLGFPGLRARTETTAIVGHWTGGENGATGVHRTLIERRLSVHFVIEADGLVVQYADASRRCDHGGAAWNGRSVGIELVNRANANATSFPPRTLLRERIRGQERVYTAFFAAQVRAFLALCEALCGAYDLPLDVPRGPDGDVRADGLTEAQLAAFRGVAGHYLAPMTTKQDPGLSLLRAVAALAPRASQPPEPPEPAAE